MNIEVRAGGGFLLMRGNRRYGAGGGRLGVMDVG